MKTWRYHNFQPKHYRSFAFSVHADRESGWIDITLGRHTWWLEVEW